MFKKKDLLKKMFAGNFGKASPMFRTSLDGDEVPTIGMDLPVGSKDYDDFVGAKADSGGLV